MFVSVVSATFDAAVFNFLFSSLARARADGHFLCGSLQIKGALDLLWKPAVYLLELGCPWIYLLRRMWPIPRGGSAVHVLSTCPRVALCRRRERPTLNKREQIHRVLLLWSVPVPPVQKHLETSKRTGDAGFRKRCI